MKIALYVEDGLEQIVLTPTSEAEKDILGKLHQHGRALAIHRGELYPCPDDRSRPQASRDSSIIVLHPIGGTAPHPRPEAGPSASAAGGAILSEKPRAPAENVS